MTHRFMLHWRDGTTESVAGSDIVDACNRAGIGAGALAALDYWAMDDDGREGAMSERDRIVAELARRFRSFGGGKTSEYNPITLALKDSPPQFAAGVDIGAVVDAVLELRTPAVREPAACVWSEDEGDAWETSCGHLFQFNVGGPTENGAKYCCYCGGAIEEVVYDSETEG